MSDTTPPAQDFAATVEQLETIVERLESGELSLEDALTAFEQGVRLTRDAQQRLDSAELKVRALSEDSEGRLDVTPFAGPEVPTEDPDDSKETPPW
ncbi:MULTISPECIES: exodeoxyribonuclease VII small subunit [unclassified Halomonas]|uniref:exodeoxyribonuclease VII small subunit n=1 Tax=unclassified Halomonas TaxID=2609666 RepID=UPI0006DA9A4F|nr:MULTISPECIES: exodeoxyribonuclease VII small subunit [unclassified Halomonas]KPQ22369.1 MAG: exodeoxyribonuclease VII, small subunit [Halomonas sp. HL-93]SBR45212.1 Exodeoxyribonuclease VII small subunit [Halomonas sp. HL-93]SNY97668.1 Exodeoxyribonuclease VII small subunit [Halomonas sp. hl-4]